MILLNALFTQINILKFLHLKFVSDQKINVFFVTASLYNTMLCTLMQSLDELPILISILFYLYTQRIVLF